MIVSPDTTTWRAGRGTGRRHGGRASAPWRRYCLPRPPVHRCFAASSKSCAGHVVSQTPRRDRRLARGGRRGRGATAVQSLCRSGHSFSVGKDKGSRRSSGMAFLVTAYAVLHQRSPLISGYVQRAYLRGSGAARGQGSTAASAWHESPGAGNSMKNNGSCEVLLGDGVMYTTTGQTRIPACAQRAEVSASLPGRI